MEKVILKGDGVGDQIFDRQHAEDILNFQKINPPTVWWINDPNFDFIDGKIFEAEAKPEPEED